MKSLRSDFRSSPRGCHSSYWRVHIQLFHSFLLFLAVSQQAVLCSRLRHSGWSIREHSLSAHHVQQVSCQNERGRECQSGRSQGHSSPSRAARSSYCHHPKKKKECCNSPELPTQGLLVIVRGFQRILV